MNLPNFVCNFQPSLQSLFDGAGFCLLNPCNVLPSSQALEYRRTRHAAQSFSMSSAKQNKRVQPERFWPCSCDLVKLLRQDVAKMNKDPSSFQLHFSFHHWFNLLTITCSACCGHPRGSWSLKTRSCATTRGSRDVSKIDTLDIGSSIAMGGTFYKWPTPGVPQKPILLSCLFIFGSHQILDEPLRNSWVSCFRYMIHVFVFRL